MMKCSKCGKEYDDSFTFCPHCAEPKTHPAQTTAASPAAAQATGPQRPPNQQLGYPPTPPPGLTKQKSGKLKWVLLAVGIIVVIAIIAVVVSSSKKSTSTTTTGKTTAPPSQASNSSSNNSAGAISVSHVGSTINISGTGLAVTVLKVVDPAQGADPADNPSTDVPHAGNRFIGVELQIVNQSNALVSDNANNNVVVVGSDNQTYTDDTATLSEGTNFDSGDYNIGPGASTTGWVAFQLRTGVNVSKIQFTFQTGTGSSVGEWLP